MRTEQTFADWRGLIADRSQAKRYFDLTHALDLVYGVDERWASAYGPAHR